MSIKKYILTLVGNDLHISYEDPDAVRAFITYARDNQPDKIILNGDVMDLGEISKFDAIPDEEHSLKEEIRRTRLFFETLRKHAPNARIIYQLANHENRFRQDLIMNSIKYYELMQDEGFNLEGILRLDKLGIECITQTQKSASWIGSYVMDQGFAIGHFKKVAKNSGYTVTNLMNDFWCSVMQGHVHRMGMITKTPLDGKVYYGIESGCLCKLNPDYMLHANWQLGFVTIKDGEPLLHYL